MIKTLLSILLALTFTLGTTGCSLFGSSDEDTESAELVEDEYAKDDFEGGDELADGEDDLGDELGDEESLDDGADDLFNDGEVAEGEEPMGEDDFQEDEYPDDDYADAASDIETEEGTEGLDDGDFAVGESGDDIYQEDVLEIPEDTLSSNEEQDLFAGESEVIEEQDYSANMGGDELPTESFQETSGFVPVKKMKPAAFRRAGANVNRLYAVRDGEDMSAVAQKIYGSDRSSDLLSWNGHFAGKSLKAGDKIYYSSPISPNDQEMKTYYEDNNINPQFYTAKRGENIRTVAGRLLGNERSWMEIYATNADLETKWDLQEGTQFRYWDGKSAPAPAIAQVEKPSPVVPVDDLEDDFADAPVDDFAAADDIGDLDEDFDDAPEIADANIGAPGAGNIDPPPGEKIDDFADDDFNDPPPALGSTSVAPPPPPPAAKSNVAPPPPPPLDAGKGFGKSKFAKNLNTKNAVVKGQDDTMIMGALGGLLILAAVILLVFIRRSRAKRVNFTQTQV